MRKISDDKKPYTGKKNPLGQPSFDKGLKTMNNVKKSDQKGKSRRSTDKIKVSPSKKHK